MIKLKEYLFIVAIMLFCAIPTIIGLVLGDPILTNIKCTKQKISEAE